MKTIDDDVFKHATACVAAWKRPLLITHTKPDGDALGSMVAMQMILASQGRDPIALLYDRVPSRYDIFTPMAPIVVMGAGAAEHELSTVDGIIILDTCAYSQLEPLADWLRTVALPKLIVDHHSTRDDVGDMYLIDESAAANCLILYDWARAAGWPLSVGACVALFIGIAMDTGWFRHSNTDTRVLRAAAELAERGADPHRLYQRLFLRETPARLHLLGEALKDMELTLEGRIAIMVLAREAFSEARATQSDTEDIVGEPLRIASVLVSVLLADSGDGVVRMSLRSKTPIAQDDPDVDVAAVAQRFGGGGHRRAAGARTTGLLSDIRRDVLHRVTQALAGTPNRDA
ncbi:MAG: bifunctional oligoribonuclease/PAP phosphatase NrnA [Phycisphaerae bacterium]